MRRRLPAKIDLPFGYRIKVALVTDAEMLLAMDEEERTELADSLWDVDCRTIFVRRRLSGERKAEMLGQELDHAMNDWRHWVRDGGDD